MKELDYLESLLEDKKVRDQINKALSVLEKHRVFSSLLEASSKQLQIAMEANPESTNLLITQSAKHWGYSACLKDLRNIDSFAKAFKNVTSKKNKLKYGVKEEDLK